MDKVRPNRAQILFEEDGKLWRGRAFLNLPSISMHYLVYVELHQKLVQTPSGQGLIEVTNRDINFAILPTSSEQRREFTLEDGTDYAAEEGIIALLITDVSGSSTDAAV